MSWPVADSAANGTIKNHQVNFQVAAPGTETPKIFYVRTVEQILSVPAIAAGSLCKSPLRLSLSLPPSPQQGSFSWACKKHEFPGPFTLMGGSLDGALQGIGMCHNVPSSSSCKFMEDSAQ